VKSPLEAPKPVGRQTGLGTQVSGTQLNFTQGSLDVTNQNLDAAIQGDGFFQVQTIVDGQERTVYTRAGNFSRDALGNLVLTNSVGARLEPVITIPQDAVQIVINQQGLVQVQTQGAVDFSDVGQISLARFVNPSGLEQIGKNLYKDTPASGPPILANPTQDGMGSLQQGALELSNVDPVRELVELIRTQRSFELNSQSIQSADQLLQTVNNLRRF
jgi:flagellar basal-body rod protein FlgG